MKSLNLNTDLELTIYINQEISKKHYKDIDELVLLREKSKWIMFRIWYLSTEKIFSYRDNRIITNTDLYFLHKREARKRTMP